MEDMVLTPLTVIVAVSKGKGAHDNNDEQMMCGFHQTHL